LPKGIAGSLDSSPGAGNVNLENVNPGFSPDLPHDHPRKLNCINCAIATDASLAGHPASALSSSEGELILVLEDWFNQSFRSASPESIVSELQNAGPGSRGIVYGERPKPEVGIDGHVFNAYNDGGVIRFVDGQNNSIPDLSTMRDFGFLRTH
jgi:filamentous hemagglutinin